MHRFFYIVHRWTTMYKYETILFCLALIAQLALLTSLIAVNGSGKSVFLNSSEGDAEEHLLITERLLTHGGFYSGEITVPFGPLETIRMPIYPMIAAAFLFITDWNYAGTIFLQQIFGALAIVVLYRLMKRLVGERAAFIGSLVAVFDLQRLFLMTGFSTESVFFLFLFGAILAAVIIIEQVVNFSRNKKSAYLVIAATGVLFALAGLTRYFAYFLGLLTGIFFVFYFSFCVVKRRMHWFFATKLIVIFFAAFFVILIPWSIRSKVHFDTWRISASGQWNLYNRNLIRLYEYRDGYRGKSHQSINDMLEAKFFADTGADPSRPFKEYYLRDYSYGPYFYKEANKTIRENLGLYIKVALWRLIPFAVDSNVHAVLGYTDQYLFPILPFFNRYGIQIYPHIFWATRFVWIALYAFVFLVVVLKRKLFKRRLYPYLYLSLLVLLTAYGGEWSFGSRHKLPFVMIFYSIIAYCVIALRQKESLPLTYEDKK